jgi:hypothetical protein
MAAAAFVAGAAVWFAAHKARARNTTTAIEVSKSARSEAPYYYYSVRFKGKKCRGRVPTVIRDFVREIQREGIDMMVFGTKDWEHPKHVSTQGYWVRLFFHGHFQLPDYAQFVHRLLHKYKYDFPEDCEVVADGWLEEIIAGRYRELDERYKRYVRDLPEEER